MPGPPKKSNSHKKATGSRNIHSGEDLTPEPLTEIPDYPDELEEYGRDEWKRVCSLLLGEQFLTEWDLPSLRIMCMAYEKVMISESDIKEHGSYQRSQSGYEQQRPIVAERDKWLAIYLKLLDWFGGNVVARSRMKRVKPVEAKKNPFESI